MTLLWTTFTVTEKHYYTILGDLRILCACDYCEDMYLPRRRVHGRWHWRGDDYEFNDYEFIDYVFIDYGGYLRAEYD